MEGSENDSTSLLSNNKPPRRADYSTFLEPGGSIDSGLSFSNDHSEPAANGISNAHQASSIEDTREKVSIAWSNIDAFVELPGPSCWKGLCTGPEAELEPTSKQVLFNVSGKVEAGTLLAIMGASGAGKTTLLNVLAHRNISQLHVTGTVEVNDHPIGIEINSVSAYIQQEDLFIGSLTVREHLTFQAYLRMDKHVPNDQRLARVEEVITQLGMKNCADSIIGIPPRLRGISGGEKKRLAFASEVLTDPPMLFVDEPTSGLDSFMAQSLVAALQGLAAQGRTIICTIHQPSSEVYAMFDSIMLLAEGRTAYMGTTAEAIKYFNSLGYSCPVNFNPADYFVHSLAIVPGKEENCRQRVKEICDAYSEREAEDATELEAESVERQNSFKDEVDFSSRSPYKASWCRQFRSLLWRSWITNSRDVLIFRIRLYQTIFVGLICGIVYFQQTINQDSLINVSGAIFFMLTSLSFSNLGAVTFTFPVELPVFLREHHNGMYRTDVYFLAKTFAEAPLFVFNPLLFIAIAYWMVGLRDSFERFVYAYAALVLVSVTSVSYGYIVSTASPSVTAATALSAPVMLPLLLLGGFYVKNTTIPVWLLWVRYLSWFNYAFEILLVNQWNGYGSISCNSSLTDSTTSLLNVNNSVCSEEERTGCVYNGDEFIEYLGLKVDNVWIDVYALLALAVGFRIISYLFLLRKAYKRP